MTCAWMATVDGEVSTAISAPSESMRKSICSAVSPSQPRRSIRSAMRARPVLAGGIDRRPATAARRRATRAARRATPRGARARRPRASKRAVAAAVPASRAGAHCAASAVAPASLGDDAHDRPRRRRRGSGARRGAGRRGRHAPEGLDAPERVRRVAEDGLVEADLLGLAGDGLELLQRAELEPRLGARELVVADTTSVRTRAKRRVDDRLDLAASCAAPRAVAQHSKSPGSRNVDTQPRTSVASSLSTTSVR